MKFKVGDRVEHEIYGKGTVIGFSGLSTPLVEFDNPGLSLHDGNMAEKNGTRGKYGHCWYTSDIKSLNSQTVVIYPKGLETIALLKEGNKIIKQASAKCNPTDEFDFNIGAKLAFSRLMGEEVRDNRKFKVGDKVRLRPGLVIRHKYDGITLLPSMKHDDVMTVDEVLSENRYFTNIGKIYSAEMLELVTESLFDWEAFKQGKFAVHCDTEEKAKAFLKECGERGIRWGYSRQNVGSCFLWIGKEDTCYKFHIDVDGMLQGSPLSYDTVIEYQLSIREVKRPAKVGEWIKAIDVKGYKYGNYQSGDIMKVEKFYCSSDVVECEFNGTTCRLIADEYVVLENYQPEAKPFFSQSTIDEISRYTNKELINELSRRLEDKQ